MNSSFRNLNENKKNNSMITNYMSKIGIVLGIIAAIIAIIVTIISIGVNK